VLRGDLPLQGFCIVGYLALNRLLRLLCSEKTIAPPYIETLNSSAKDDGVGIHLLSRKSFLSGIDFTV